MTYTHEAGIIREFNWWRFVAILLAIGLAITMYIAIRNSRPVCHEVIKAETGETMCIYWLGEVDPANADVIRL